MGLSNKVLIGGAAGVAALAFIGVGAGASFSDTASAGGSVTTGDVHLQLTDAGAQYTSEQYIIKNGQRTPVEIPWKSTPDSKGNGFQMTALSPVGSDFTASVPVTIQNTGSLPVQHVMLRVSDPGNNNQLETDTLVSLWDGDSRIAEVGLNSVEDTLNHTPTFTIPSNLLPVGGPARSFTVKFRPTANSQDGTNTYTNRDEDLTMAPVFTVTGSDA